MRMQKVEDVLGFWLDEIGPEGWYAGGVAIDGQVKARFEGLWHEAMAGACGPWLTDPRGALAYLIVTDQFPRNMFRDTPGAFASDALARAAAKLAIAAGWDMAVPEPGRVFLYMPLEHSESLVDQDESVRLMAERLPKTGAEYLLHARAHREVIRRFGRFPTRNAALGRVSTPGEVAWLAGGGYGQIVSALRGAGAPAA
jgi:uncharacterized protein (DUF924 family)